MAPGRLSTRARMSDPFASRHLPEARRCENWKRRFAIGWRCVRVVGKRIGTCGLSWWRRGKAVAKSPKSEGRNPKEARNPKSESIALGSFFSLRISAFFRPSGIRPSDFAVELVHTAESRPLLVSEGLDGVEVG